MGGHALQEKEFKEGRKCAGYSTHCVEKGLGMCASHVMQKRRTNKVGLNNERSQIGSTRSGG